MDLLEGRLKVGSTFALQVGPFPAVILHSSLNSVVAYLCLGVCFACAKEVSEGGEAVDLIEGRLKVMHICSANF